MTSCTIHTARQFYCRHGRYVRDVLTKRGSDFQRKITAWLDGSGAPAADDGFISLVMYGDEIVGWARTEKWRGYDTLEAFVATEWRLRGVATFAAAGLRASRVLGATAAVFHPHMAMVAARCGLRPHLFERVGDQWVSK